RARVNPAKLKMGKTSPTQSLHKLTGSTRTTYSTQFSQELFIFIINAVPEIDMRNPNANYPK
ncbi:hypothetical protein A2U01_0106908, partial [Trifolium medium]|nr:hypothetical protein [Trifolium medium]